jgi:hypothetical protein
MFLRNVGVLKTTWCQNSESYYLNNFRHEILRPYKQQSVTKACQTTQEVDHNVTVLADS